MGLKDERRECCRAELTKSSVNALVNASDNVTGRFEATPRGDGRNRAA
jgi:hypothetical protein